MGARRFRATEKKEHLKLRQEERKWRRRAGPEEVVLTTFAECAQPIKYLDLTGIEDTVQFPLVDQIMRVRAFSCFDKKLLERDEKRFLASGVVKEAHFSTKRDGEGWEISLAARGNQLVVESVDVVGLVKT